MILQRQEAKPEIHATHGNLDSTGGLYGSFKSLFNRESLLFKKDSIFKKESQLQGNSGVKLCKDYNLVLAETMLINQVLKANSHVEKINYQYAIDVLKREHGVTQSDVKQLFLIANNPQEKKPSLKRSADIIRHHFGEKRLSSLLEGLWLVASANGEIEASSRSSITIIANAVGVNSKQNQRAHQGALRRSKAMRARISHTSKH